MDIYKNQIRIIYWLQAVVNINVFRTALPSFHFYFKQCLWNLSIIFEQTQRCLYIIYFSQEIYWLVFKWDIKNVTVNNERRWFVTTILRQWMYTGGGLVNQLVNVLKDGVSLVSIGDLTSPVKQCTKYTTAFLLYCYGRGDQKPLTDAKNASGKTEWLTALPLSSL